MIKYDKNFFKLEVEVCLIPYFAQRNSAPIVGAMRFARNTRSTGKFCRFGKRKKNNKLFILPNMVRSGVFNRVNLLRDPRCCQKKILFYHGRDNIVINQRWPPRVWLNIKVVTTCFNFCSKHILHVLYETIYPQNVSLVLCFCRISSLLKFV